MSSPPAITAQRLIKALGNLALKSFERRGAIISFGIPTGLHLLQEEHGISVVNTFELPPGDRPEAAADSQRALSDEPSKERQVLRLEGG